MSSVASASPLEPLWDEDAYGSVAPDPIWRIIFAFVAADSRAYLIPLRRVCKRWSALAKIVSVQFLDPTTRLLEVSARDGLAKLCIWAHDKGGAVGRSTLIAAARSGDVGIVSLVCDWSNKGWLNEDEDYAPPVSFSSRYNLHTNETMIFRIVSDTMLQVATEVGAGQLCRHLIDTRGAGTRLDMFMTAARFDRADVAELAAQLIVDSGRNLNGLMKNVIIVAAAHGSLKVLRRLETLHGFTGFWKFAFNGAVMGGCTEVYDVARAMLPSLSEVVGTGPTQRVKLVNQSLSEATTARRIEIVARLLADGADKHIVTQIARRLRDPELGRLVIDASVTEEEVVGWEQDRIKQCRADPLDLSD